MAETKPKMEASLEDECHSASAASAAAPIIFRRSFQRRNSVSELLAEDKRENEKSHVMACVSICESNDASARPNGHPLVLTPHSLLRPTYVRPVCRHSCTQQKYAQSRLSAKLAEAARLRKCATKLQASRPTRGGAIGLGAGRGGV